MKLYICISYKKLGCCSCSNTKRRFKILFFYIHRKTSCRKQQQGVRKYNNYGRRSYEEYQWGNKPRQLHRKLSYNKHKI